MQFMCLYWFSHHATCIPCSTNMVSPWASFGTVLAFTVVWVLGGVLNKTVIPLALFGYEMIIISKLSYIQLSTTQLIGYPLSHVQRNHMEYLLHITKKEGLDFLKCRQKAQMNAISRQVKFSVVVFLAVPSHLNKFTLLLFLLLTDGITSIYLSRIPKKNGVESRS